MSWSSTTEQKQHAHTRTSGVIHKRTHGAKETRCIGKRVHMQHVDVANHVRLPNSHVIEARRELSEHSQQLRPSERLELHPRGIERLP